MAKGTPAKSALSKVFDLLDDIFHKLEMYAKGENLQKKFTISTDGREVKELIDKAMSLIIEKPNFTQANLNKYYSYFDRILGLAPTYKTYRQEKDDSKAVANFFWLTDNLYEIAIDVIHPFYERHSINQQEDSFFDVPSESEPHKTSAEEAEPARQKLTWLGKPAHLALLIEILVEKGYLRVTPYGERTARVLLDFIEIQGHKTTAESLGRLLQQDKYPIQDIDIVNRFKKIPHRNELK